MDTFMDKLAHKLTAQEMIKANSAADAEEMNKMRSQIKEYREILDRLQLLVDDSAAKLEAGAFRIENAKVDGAQINRLVDESIAKIEQMQQNTESLEELKALNESLKEELKADLEIFALNFDDVKADVEVTKAAVKETKTGVEAAKAGIEATKADVEATKAGIEATKAGIEATKAGIEETKAGIEEARADIEEAKVAVEEARAGMEATRESIEATVENLAESKAVIEENKAFNEELKVLVEDMKTSGEENKATIVDRVKSIDENVHRECVKVYRNVQAVVVEENNKQADGFSFTFKEMKKKLGLIMSISIAALLISAGGVIFQILVYLHII